MKLVIIESPFAADTPEQVQENIEYARKCVRDSLGRGEAPIASHLLYTQDGILDDNIPDERQWGIDAGLAWRSVAEKSVVYTDLGISRGMEYGIKAAEDSGNDIEYRSIGWQKMTNYIDWSGGPMPVDLDQLVDVVMANGERWNKHMAGNLDWGVSKERRFYPLRIVKYRLSEDQ